MTELLLSTNTLEEAEANDNPLVIYTNGSCPTGRGPGGCCAVILARDGTKTVIVAGHADTTKPRMELYAAIGALERYQDGSETSFQIISDSKYLIDGMKHWVKRWEKEGWKNAKRKPVQNKDLWLRLIDLARGLDIEWVWIEPSEGDPYNELATRRALEAAEKIRLACRRSIG